MRKLGIVVGIILALIIAVLVIVPLVVDANQYHGVVQAQLQKALGRPVTFGQMHLSLTPPSLKLDDLKIGEAPQFGGGQFATAHSVNVSVKLLPLIHKQVDIRSLTLDQPQVQLIKDAKGVWNFSTLGKTEAPAPAPSATPSPKPAPTQSTNKPSGTNPPPSTNGGGNNLELGELVIKNGQVTIEDLAKKSRATYNNIDLTLRNYAPGKAFDFDAALHLPGSGNEQLKLSGTAGPIADQMTDTPFAGQLEFDQVSIASLEKLSGTSMNGTSGVLTGNLSAKNQKGTLAAEGSLKLADGTIRNVKLDYPVNLDFKANDQLQSDRIHIDNANLKLGNTPITIAGDMNAGVTPSQLDLRLTLKNASIQEIARLASAFGVAFNPGMQVSGGIAADLHATGPTTGPALNGTINASNLRVSGSSLKQPVSVNSLALTMTPEEIRSAPFTATTGGTNLAIQFALSKYTSPSPSIDATVRTANSQISELLAMARAYGVSAVEGVDGTGTINLDLHAAGPIKNASALQMSGTGKISNASIKTASLTQPVNVRNADLRFTSNSMAMQNLAASVGHTNATGSMTVQNFSAPHLQFNLHADRVNVAELQQLTAAPAPAKRASLFSLIPTANAAPAPTPSIVDNMSGGGNVTIDSLEYDQLVLQNLQSTVAIDHGVIHMNPVTALIYGGQEHGTITVDMRPTPIAVSIQSKLDQVDANKLISSVSSVRNTLYGLLAANANTNFRAASAQDIARTLNGTLNIDLTKGRLAHVNILNQLASVARFAGGAAPQAQASQPFTDILRLTGAFNVVNGLAQTNNLLAQIPGGSVAAQGAVNLASNALDMHVTAILDKALSQKVGGTQVGGFMQTALANAQGELVIPVLVTGTLDSPRFAPDVQKIAQMKLQNMLPTAANPGNAVSSILGAVMKGKGQGGQQQQGLGGVLGAIAGQQQQQQQQQGTAQPNQPQANQPQQQQQNQQQNPLGGLLNQIMQQRQQKKQPQQPQPPPK